MRVSAPVAPSGIPVISTWSEPVERAEVTLGSPVGEEGAEQPSSSARQDVRQYGVVLATSTGEFNVMVLERKRMTGCNLHPDPALRGTPRARRIM